MHIHTSISIFIQKLKSQPKTIENFYKNQSPPLFNLLNPFPQINRIRGKG